MLIFCTTYPFCLRVTTPPVAVRRGGKLFAFFLRITATFWVVLLSVFAACLSHLLPYISLWES